MNAAGIYSGTLMEAGMEELGKNKTPCMYLQYEIGYISNGSDWDALERPIRRDVKFWLSDAAYDNTCDTLESMGWNFDFVNPKFANENVNNAVLECEHDEYQGKVNERWYLSEYKGFSRQSVPKEMLRKLSARFNTRKVASVKPVTNSPPPVKLPWDKDDSDIPI